MSYSVRLQYLQKLRGCSSTPMIDFRTIAWEEIQDVFLSNEVQGFADYLYEKSKKLSNIFVHACPRDESLNPNLSFAGIYRSYKPIQSADIQSNMQNAAYLLMYKRFGDHANYYFNRHRLVGNKEVDIILSRGIDNTWGFGTGYIDTKGNYLFQMYNSPLAIYRREAQKYIGSVYSARPQNILCQNIIEMLTEVSACVNDAVDVEFVFSIYSKVYVNEIRPISAAHKKNWKAYFEITGDHTTYQKACSTIVDSVGTAFGKAFIVDPCHSLDLDRALKCSEDYIFVLRPKDILLFLETVNSQHAKNLKILVKFDNYIIDNHLLYILYEDPEIQFISKIIHEEIQHEESIQVYSNGVESLITRDR